MVDPKHKGRAGQSASFKAYVHLAGERPHNTAKLPGAQACSAREHEMKAKALFEWAGIADADSRQHFQQMAQTHLSIARSMGAAHA